MSGGDYETNYLKGLISIVIVFLLLVVLWLAITPVWASFGGIVYNVASSVPFLSPTLNGLSTILGNFTLTIAVMFLLLFIFVIIYVIVLPFLRNPNQNEGGWIQP